VLRSYAKFLEEVKNDPWTASKYYTEADKQEEVQELAQNDARFTAGVAEDAAQAMLSQVDERNNAVMVINASGIIQMANKMLLKMLGYKKSDMEGACAEAQHLRVAWLLAGDDGPGRGGDARCRSPRYPAQAHKRLHGLLLRAPCCGPPVRWPTLPLATHNRPRRPSPTNQARTSP
jgi:PAS domain-containing protein